MAKHRETTVEPEIPTTTATETKNTEVRADSEHLNDIFKRGINGARPIKSIRLKQTLTRPFLAAAHFKKLLFTCQGEMRIMELPTKGRKASMQQVRVIDGVDLENGEESTLMVNEMMSKALERAGYAVVAATTDDESTEKYVNVDGSPLSGHSFAFRSGSVNEDGGYRRVDVVEVEVEN